MCSQHSAGAKEQNAVSQVHKPALLFFAHHVLWLLFSDDTTSYIFFFGLNKFCSYPRLAVDGSDEALRKEQSRVQELQQLLEQERAVSARKNREEEEQRGVR